MKHKSYQTKLKRHYREQVHRDIFSLAQMDIERTKINSRVTVSNGSKTYVELKR